MTIKEPCFRYFHNPRLSPKEYESWLARDTEFIDTYADWVSGTCNALIGKYLGHPEQAYARMVLRSYLPGFAEAEESVDPYRENISATPSRRNERQYSLSEKCAAVMMAERLGIRKTARKLGIPRSTIQGWIKAEGSYKENAPATPKLAGRPRGQRPEKPCSGCGTPTRTHVDYKPLCRPCYLGTEEYRKDRSQWASDVIMLKRAVSRLPTTRGRPDW